MIGETHLETFVKEGGRIAVRKPAVMPLMRPLRSSFHCETSLMRVDGMHSDARPDRRAQIDSIGLMMLGQAVEQDEPAAVRPEQAAQLPVRSLLFEDLCAVRFPPTRV